MPRSAGPLLCRCPPSTVYDFVLEDAPVAAAVGEVTVVTQLVYTAVIVILVITAKRVQIYCLYRNLGPKAVAPLVLEPTVMYLDSPGTLAEPCST